MPGIVKIGITDGPIETRLRGLDNTSLPLPFRCYFAIESDRYKEIETYMHDAFADSRVRPNREFFELDPDRAVAALKISGGAIIQVTEDMIDELGKRVEDDHLIHASETTAELYAQLRESILEKFPLTVTPRKQYIAFKATTNVVDVELQKAQIKVSINMRSGELIDPLNLANDVSHIGHWGNGDYLCYIRSHDDIDKVMPLIEQSYEKNK